jgi:peptidoglycan/LPS O-acetylase OafA/YrhL
MNLDKEVVKAERPHFSALDGLRGIAILLVVTRHCLDANLSAFAGWKHTLHQNAIASLGWGVVLFFVLSGFLITGILLDSKADPNYYLNFYGRRILRIFPLYYGTLLAFWVVYLFHGFGADNGLFIHRLPWLLTYTSNIRITLHDNWSFIFNGHSLGHFWSLAVEEQFYLIWPLIVLRCSTGVLRQICLAAIAGGFVSRMVLVYAFHNVIGSCVFLSCQSDALAMGALLAVMVRERELVVASLAWPLALAGAAIWMATLLDGNALLTAGMSGFAMMSTGALALCLYHPVSKWFAHPILRAFGKYSYGIYVLHVILLPFVYTLRDKLGQVVFVCFFISLSFCAGWLSWHLFEAHFLKLKRFFPASFNRTWKPNFQTNPAKVPVTL